MGKERVTVEQFREVIDILNPCMDDYLYILDLKNDYYCISANAVERFCLPGRELYHATADLEKVTHPDDYPKLAADIEQIKRKEKDFHNLQYRWMGKDNRAIWINCRGQILFDEEENPEYMVGCINEIGKKQKADNVSGLLGEFSLQSDITSKSIKLDKGFILRLGIDNFKEINENKGMDYGDMILRKTAESIGAAMLPGQRLYRIVADEFVVVDFTGRKEKDAEELYQRIHEQIGLFIEENGYEVFYTVSAGVVGVDEPEKQSYENLMKLSEFALNEAKTRGKNKCYVYEKEDYQKCLYKRELVYIMRQSVNKNFEGFETYFQPVVDIKEGRMIGAETLLRFQSETTGMVSPVEFIPLLEETGLIIPVGKWVLCQAMAAASKIQKMLPDFKISVNLSYIQVLKSNILADIVEGVEKYRLHAESFLVELTESGFLESDTNFINFCTGLQKHGIPLALDDFGTGYSNFHYLYNLNPNTIKIDRSFTIKALHNDYEYNLLKHMVDMVHSIDLKLCIEGIETKEELEKVKKMNPDYIQGYYFGRPAPLSVFLEEYVGKLIEDVK